MQILKNLFQVGGDLNGITFDGKDAGYNDANTYIIARDEGLIMFDAGCGDTLDQIFDNMKYWSLNPEDIKYCILTHPHFDHTGGGASLKEKGVSLFRVERQQMLFEKVTTEPVHIYTTKLSNHLKLIQLFQKMKNLKYLE